MIINKIRAVPEQCVEWRIAGLLMSLSFHWRALRISLKQLPMLWNVVLITTSLFSSFLNLEIRQLNSTLGRFNITFQILLPSVCKILCLSQDPYTCSSIQENVPVFSTLSSLRKLTLASLDKWKFLQKSQKHGGYPWLKSCFMEAWPWSEIKLLLLFPTVRMCSTWHSSTFSTTIFLLYSQSTL